LIAESTRYSAITFTQANASDRNILFIRTSAASFPSNFMRDFLRVAAARKVESASLEMDDDAELFLRAER
jgi:hypothetical protein